MRAYRNLIAILIVIGFMGVLFALTSGCASIKYTNGVEILEVKTLWKSLDGLWADRDGEDFGLVIDKTYTHDPLRAIGELLETYQQLYGMGFRFDPARPTAGGEP